MAETAKLLNPEKADTSEGESSEGKEESEGDADVEEAEQPADDEALTEEELLERLEAEQEKITKDNQRRLDERKDRLEAAQRRVRDLNDRFADWYYVIPEDTYTMLRIKRDELLEGSVAPKTQGNPQVPQFIFPIE